MYCLCVCGGGGAGWVGGVQRGASPPVVVGGGRGGDRLDALPVYGSISKINDTSPSAEHSAVVHITEQACWVEAGAGGAWLGVGGGEGRLQQR